MKLFFVVLVSTAGSTAMAESGKLDLLWKARGLQAQVAIEKLSKKNGDSKGKNLSKKEHCKWNLENVFFAFANSELSKIVRESPKDAEVFKMLFSDPEAKTGSKLTQLSVTYGKGSTEPDAFQTVLVAEGWRVTTIPKAPDILGIRGGGCLYVVPLKDPLSTTVDTD